MTTEPDLRPVRCPPYIQIMQDSFSAFGSHAPGRLDRCVIAATSSLPNNWLGLRLAIGLRRIVTTRLHGRGLDVTRWGVKMRLHPGDNGCEKNLLFTPQMYEVTERRELARAMAAMPDKPFTFVDIGANVGLFSLFVAARRPDARILAIEPEPGNVARLRFNVSANSLPIEVHPLALGSASGSASVVLNTRDRGGTTVSDEASGGGRPVPRLTLLELLQKQNVARVDALKIDTEATEDKILAPFFGKAPPSLWPRMVIIEDSRHAWRVDLFDLMQEIGYVEMERSKHNVILALRILG